MFYLSTGSRQVIGLGRWSPRHHKFDAIWASECREFPHVQTNIEPTVQKFWHGDGSADVWWYFGSWDWCCTRLVQVLLRAQAEARMLTMLTGSDGQKCFGEMFPKKLKDLCIYRKIVDLSSLWGRRWGMQVSPAHPVSGMLGASTMTTRFFLRWIQGVNIEKSQLFWLYCTRSYFQVNRKVKHRWWSEPFSVGIVAFFGLRVMFLLWEYWSFDMLPRSNADATMTYSKNANLNV